MATDDETAEAIEEAIDESVKSGIKRAQDDTGSMEEHSLADRIAWLKFRQSQQASRVGTGGRYFKFVPPGTA